MPVYADCDYCGKKSLKGHLKRFRFNERKFCANCHLKYSLPHKFHEIENYQDRPFTDEEFETPPVRTIETDLPSNARIKTNIVNPPNDVLILDEVAVPKTGKELYEEAIKQENNIDESSPEYIETRKQIKEGLEQVIDSKIKQVDRLVSEYQEEKVEEVKNEPDPNVFAKARLEKQAKEDGTSIEEAEQYYEIDLEEEDKVESTKKEEEKEGFVITAFNYKEANLKYRSIIGDEDIWRVGRKATRILLYHNVDFVVIAKIKRDD